MIIRRVIVWATSILFGVIATAGTILFFGTTFERFSTGFLFTGDLSLIAGAGYASLAFIWLDFILQTKYLRT